MTKEDIIREITYNIDNYIKDSEDNLTFESIFDAIESGRWSRGCPKGSRCLSSSCSSCWKQALLNAIGDDCITDNGFIKF